MIFGLLFGTNEKGGELMVGVLTNSVAEILYGREEQLELYERLNHIDKARVAMVEMKTRRMKLDGIDITEESLEKLCKKFGIIAECQ